MSGSILATALGGITVVYLALWALLHLTQDSKEPPIVSSTFPFITAMLGLKRLDYYNYLRDIYRNSPIITLRIPGLRLYVINSLDLVPAVQRQWRALSFGLVELKLFDHVMGVSKETVTILERDLGTGHGLISCLAHTTRSSMSNGASLDSVNARAFEVFDEALKDPKDFHTVHLWEWMEELITSATTEALYGSSNPMRESNNLEAWHKFLPQFESLLLGIIPHDIFLKTAVKGREQLVEGFAKYYMDGGYNYGSAFIQQFVGHMIEQRVPEDDVSRILLLTVFISVINTIPTAFWAVLHIFNDPIVLEDCRNEVSQAVQHEQDGTSTIDLSFVLNSCPILLSTYQEVLRHHSMANLVRIVTEDHMLDNRYLLKKGGMVMMSADAVNSDPAIWGDSASSFYHKRFLKEQDAAIPTGIDGSGSKRRNPAAFRPFGRGSKPCPGRHLATSEALLLTSLLLLRFDIRPANGKPWILPTVFKSSRVSSMEQPDHDVEVELIPRLEAKGRLWRITSSAHQNSKAL